MERKGFTLIEILIVVAIIAILASIVLVGLGPTQQSGRDARRVSDLHETQNALELYYSKCGYYPGTATGGVCAVTATAGYGTFTAGAYTNMALALTSAGIGVNTIPLDPTNAGVHIYRFRTNGTSASTYVLSAVLENTNNAIFTNYAPLSATQLTTYTSGDALDNACKSPEYCMSL